MQIYNEINNLNKHLSIALGFFDGVHLGHCAVIKSAVDFAKQNGTKSAVITFKDHPCCYLYEDVVPQYIISKHKKEEMLEALGVDFLYYIDFKDIAKLSAQEYLEFLSKNIEPKAISTGFNHNFGANKSGDVKFLKTNEKKYNYRFFEIKEKTYHLSPITYHSTISSTLIRQNLSDGNIEHANKLLGFNFAITSVVVEGEKIGRTIGFPTANLIYPENLVVLAKGVYQVKVEINNVIASPLGRSNPAPKNTASSQAPVNDHKITYNAIANFGTRPTVSKSAQNILEVHILNFDKDIYGQKIKVEFLKRIREERAFNSLDELKAQIKKDIITVI